MQITFTLVLCAFLFFITHAGYLCDEQKNKCRTNEWAMKISKLKNVIFQYAINYILIKKQVKNIYN